MSRIIVLLAVCYLSALGCQRIEPPEKVETLDQAVQNSARISGVAITFDDNFYDDWIKMIPILEKYNAKVTFFISPNYPAKRKNSDKQKILTLFNAGHEIGSHSLNHPKLQFYLKKHDLFQYYIKEILPTISFFDSLGIDVKSFAYPYGYNTKQSDLFLEKYFDKVRTVARYAKGDKYDNVTKLNENRIDGLSISFQGANSLKIYKAAILKAKAEGGILVLIEHRPVLKANEKNPLSYSLLDSICHFVNQQNMNFYRMQEL